MPRHFTPAALGLLPPPHSPKSLPPPPPLTQAPPPPPGALVCLTEPCPPPLVLPPLSPSLVLHKCTTLAVVPMPHRSPRLRPYQLQCVFDVLRAFSEYSRVAMSLPVGSGKTVIFADIIGKVPPPKPGASRTLVLAHREELLDQAVARIRAAQPHLSVGKEQGKFSVSDEVDVVVASVPSLGRKGSPRLAKFNPDHFKLIVIDECHHAAAPTYIRVLRHFGAFEPTTHVRVLGCTATLKRHDQKELHKVFQHIAYECRLEFMWDQAFLSPLVAKRIDTHLELRDVVVDKRTRDYAVAGLSRAIDTPQRNELVVETWRRLASGECKSTLAFAANVQHVKSLAECFRAIGVDARFVVGSTPKDERESVVSDFRDGKFPVLVNCAVFTEGTDIPNIDCLLMTRPTRAAGLFQQMIGRGLRLFPGKDKCLCLDFVDSNMTDMQTIATLFGLSWKFDPQGGDIRATVERMQQLLRQCDRVMEARTLDEAEEIAARHREEQERARQEREEQERARRRFEQARRLAAEIARERQERLRAEAEARARREEEERARQAEEERARRVEAERARARREEEERARRQHVERARREEEERARRERRARQEEQERMEQARKKWEESWSRIPLRQRVVFTSPESERQMLAKGKSDIPWHEHEGSLYALVPFRNYTLRVFQLQHNKWAADALLPNHTMRHLPASWESKQQAVCGAHAFLSDTFPAESFLLRKGEHLRQMRGLRPTPKQAVKVWVLSNGRIGKETVMQHDRAAVWEWINRQELKRNIARMTNAARR